MNQSFREQYLIALNDRFDGVRKYCLSHFMCGQILESNFLTTCLELVQANLGVAILPPFVRPFLPPGVLMRDLLEGPYIQLFYAMFSPELQPEQTELIKQILSSSI